MDETTEISTAPARGAFLRNVLLPWSFGTIELVVAAAASMLLADMATSAAIDGLGLAWIWGHPLGIALVMTFDVWLGVTAWMLLRRRQARAIVAVLLSIAAGFLVPLPLYWVSVISASETVLLGHVLVVPAIALAVALLPGGLTARREPGVLA